MADLHDLSGVSTLRAALTVAIIGILVTAWGAEFVWSHRGSPGEVTVTGTLTGSRPTAFSEKRQGTYYGFRFTTPDGRQFTGTGLVTPSGSLDRHGDDVTVIYPPDAPADGRLWVSRGGLEFLPAAAGVALTLGGLRVVVIELLKRRRRRQASRVQGGT